MINFKFLKLQIKSSVWVTFGFTLFFIIVSIFAMIFDSYFWNTTVISDNGNQNIGYNGAVNVLGLTTIFGPVGEVIALVFVVSLVIKLFNIEINKGYMGSWMTLPISRTTCFWTKALTIIISSFIVVFSNLLIQLLISVAKGFSDFGGYEVWVLIKLNLGLLLVFWLIAVIAVFFAIAFHRTSYAVTLTSIVTIFFIVLFCNSFFIQSSLKFFTIFWISNLFFFI